MAEAVDLAVVRACEERLVNLWPAVDTLLMEGWAVRFAHGYSGRANSASAVVPDAQMDAAMLDAIERLYREAGLKPTVRVTPLADAAVAPLLAARGYRFKDRSRMMTLPLDGWRGRRPDPRVRIEPAPARAWLDGVSIRQEASKRSPDHLFAIVGRIRLPAAFATLNVDGAPAGFGMAATDRGYAEVGSIMVDAARRGGGVGRATVEALLGWAADGGAATAYLQVDETNAPALRLYGRLGFADLCGYATMVLD